MGDLVFESLQENFSGDKVSCCPKSQDLEILVKKGSVLSSLKTLKEEKEYSFNHLADLTAYHDADKEKAIFVVYELISMLKKRRLRVLVKLDQESPQVESIATLWSGANWLEREVFDMFGVHFEGHPDMRRILLPDSFKGYPLKKDFAVDFRQKFKDGKENNQPFDFNGPTVLDVPELGEST